MIIRPATVADSAAIATVHIRSWQTAYAHILPPDYLSGLAAEERSLRWEKILQEGQSTTHVAEDDGEIVAFVSFGSCRDENAPSVRGEIWALYAAPHAWRKGAGRSLLSHAITELSAIGFSETSLWVLTDNIRGIQFYQKAGFSPVADSNKKFELGGIEVEEIQLLRPLRF